MKEIVVRTCRVEPDHRLIGLLRTLFPDVRIRIEHTIARLPAEAGEPLMSYSVNPVYKES